MRIAIRIHEGETYPRWYGLAWIDFVRCEAVCYPIPLNVLARALYLAWVFCKTPFGQAGIRVERERSALGAKGGE